MTSKIEELNSNNIKGLVLKYSIPAIFALLIQSLYNIIDTIYVGHGIGGLGIAAMTIVYPIQLIMLAVTNLIAIGGGALISISLGKKEFENANKLAGNVIITLLVIGILMTVLCLMYLEPILIVFGAGPTIYPLAREYMVIAFAATIVTLLLQGFLPLLRAEGKLKIVMITTIISVILNIILAPIFLFYFNWGMWGVSTATQISKFVVLIIIILYYFKGKTTIELKLKHYIPDFKLIFKAALLGLSSFLRAGGASFTSLVINYLALKYAGPEGLAAFGLAYRISIFLFMPMFGLIQGSQPIIGYNFGANRKQNIKKTLDFTLHISLSMAILFLILIILFAKEITMIFGNNPTIIRDCPKYLIWLTIPLPIIAYQLIISGYLQAVGKILASNMIAILRQYVCFVPLMLLFSYMFQMNGLLYSYPISNAITFILLFIWMQREKKSAFSDV